jgi:hypothetical protein
MLGYRIKLNGNYGKKNILLTLEKGRKIVKQYGPASKFGILG